MKQLTEERLNVIANNSVAFPQFLHHPNGIDSDIIASLYVSAMATLDSIGMPRYLVLNRETGNGTITIGTYILSNSTKYAAVVPSAEDGIIEPN